MDHAPADVTPAAALDRFCAAFYARRPVTATFTGIHSFDDRWPDWSPEGLHAGATEMRALRRDLDAAGRIDDSRVSAYPQQVDLALADAVLEIQCAEHESRHFYRGNPSLWVGEAAFGLISLITRPFADIDTRLTALAARLAALPRFLADARRTLEATPPSWRRRAVSEGAGVETLLGEGVPAWLPGSGASARVQALVQASTGPALDACRSFIAWVTSGLATVDKAESCGADLLSLLLRRGHWCSTPVDDLAAAADRALAAARAALDERVAALGASSWPDVEARIAATRPAADDYLPRFARVWRRFRDIAAEHDLVTWPEAPIRYVPIPTQTRAAAPRLYYLFYRSPAPFDPAGLYDYVVPPIDGVAADEAERRLAAANDCAIALNHVVHHGGIGHHVQNWYASRAPSRIGQVAAVDAASRIAMFCGGSLAEGWACYACDLMEEIGALTPLERAAQQHTRVRIAARAVVDLGLHTGRLTMTEAAQFFHTRGLMPQGAAENEAVKASMFPGTPVMYWLGTQAIHDLRARLRVGRPGGPTLRQFHDRFLSYGAIPVPLIARLMTT
jgi:uncharacterized protein (DUF885 family)